MRIGAVDVGTNSVRYLVAETSPDRPPRILETGIETPRLGAGLRGGKLNRAAVERTLSALESIGAALARNGVERTAAVGTEALRRADGARELLERARELGIEVEVVEPREEAVLAWEGAVSGLPPEAGPYLVADPGGGSTELIRPGVAPKTWLFAGIPLGCVRLRDESGDGYAPARARARHLARRLPLELFSSPISLVGVGGTFTTLAAVKLGLETYDGARVQGTEVFLEEIAAIGHRVAALPLRDRKAVAGLPADRADIFPAGCAAAAAIMERGGLETAVVSDRGILHGLLLREAGGGIRN
ncbi:MAG TPA: hypothetical protein PLI51_06080 [bacterium]|nr:hypothetical protein [bacterium]HPQ66276.1 hypothetical protein [bacterium]